MLTECLAVTGHHGDVCSPARFTASGIKKCLPPPALCTWFSPFLFNFFQTLLGERPFSCGSPLPSGSSGAQHGLLPKPAWHAVSLSFPDPISFSRFVSQGHSSFLRPFISGLFSSCI